MPETSGFDLLRHVDENFKDTEVIMITGDPSIQGAVKAIETGAVNYLPKPFTKKELLTAVREVLDKLQTRRSSKQKVSQKQTAGYGLIGESDVIREVCNNIEKAAKTTATVLIAGESGTGKELAARDIHYHSQRASAQFVPINCGGIPETLVESSLFGHVKGAFTGATESKSGFFQTANGGTIFFDEISETTVAMQAKLLRALQEREISMVGSSRTTKIDVRVLAATNKDLTDLIKKKLFREDLFYRLNVITVHMPPLRERGNDILLLTHHFVEKFAKEFDRPVINFSDKAIQALKNYYWPGNVRELENIIQRLVIMAEGDVIDVPDLPSFMRYSASKRAGFSRTLAEVEAEHIKNVLDNMDGNKTKAAKILGIDRKTLREKLKKIQPPSE